MSKEKAERLSAALARGQQAARHLAPATDRLTETIAQIERALAEQRLGVCGSIELSSEVFVDEESGSRGGSQTLLAFRKEGKVWRLMIDSGPDDDPEFWSSIPLLNASRELRMLAIERLPELVEDLVRQAERQLAEVEAKQTTAAALLAALKHKNGGMP